MRRRAFSAPTGVALGRPFAQLVAGLREGLGETGFVEGRNVAIETRWAEGHYDRLPELAGDPVRRRVAVPAARHRILAIDEFRQFTAAGGLMIRGANLADGYRQIGACTGRILQGAEPGDLPFLQPTRFEFVIKLKTARALGFTMPPSLLLRADEVIQ